MKLHVGQTMYAISWHSKAKYYCVQPCKIIDIDKWGYRCACNNTIKYFNDEDIGVSLFFSFYDALKVMKKEWL